MVAGAGSQGYSCYNVSIASLDGHVLGYAINMLVGFLLASFVERLYWIWFAALYGCSYLRAICFTARERVGFVAFLAFTLGAFGWFIYFIAGSRTLYHRHIQNIAYIFDSKTTLPCLYSIQKPLMVRR